MLFHSLPFLLVFLPLVLAGYYALAGREEPRKWLLFLASLGFYGYWDIRFLPLLAGSVAINWTIAQLYSRTRFRGVVALGVVANLALLGVFKYADFFAAQLAFLGGARHESWSLILPLGISFFTFQQISYLVDLRRGQVEAYRFIDYAAYITFFPHLIAGPIVRHSELVMQLRLDPWRDGLAERLSRGTVLLVIGMTKKVALADQLAPISDRVFEAAMTGAALGVADAWVGALAFAFQIYFDFSGYSDMAIGLALLFGLAFPLNFDAPYRALSIREFWRRWHITLSRFLRDYVYIPLGGSRQAPLRQAGAVIATMLLGGLWHGAGWTFVAWGGLHGAALAVNHAWRRTGWHLPSPFAWTLTMLVVLAGWVLFRAPDFATAGTMLAAAAGDAPASTSIVPGVRKTWIIAIAAAIAILGPTSVEAALERLRPRRIIAAGAGLAIVLLMLAVGGGANNDFIYFQF
jgi:D-alanyl-lipoteichoic acid acyltransferase DltB (MBOAT superfamily)